MIKSYISSFFEAIATLASLATLITICFYLDTSKLTLYQSFGILIFLFSSSALFSLLMNQVKKSTTLKINERFKLTIEQGDLFDKHGIIVIPVNEYFDTHVGDGVISPNSIHFQFINKYYSNNIQKLDNIITQKLSGIIFSIQQRQAKQNVILKNRKYDLGTCLHFEENKNTYVLFALTHFDKNNIAYIDINEYETALKGLLDYLKQIAEDHPVYLPLFGTNFCRILKSNRQILDFIINSLNFLYHDTAFLGGIHIEIIDLSNVNLNEYNKI